MDVPVPMSLNTDGPVFESPASDESWTQLRDRTCRENKQEEVSQGRNKHARSPDFIPAERRKPDALRMSFVRNNETIKQLGSCYTATLVGKQTVEGLDAAFTDVCRPGRLEAPGT